MILRAAFWKGVSDSHYATLPGWNERMVAGTAFNEDGEKQLVDMWDGCPESDIVQLYLIHLCVCRPCQAAAGDRLKQMFRDCQGSPFAMFVLSNPFHLIDTTVAQEVDRGEQLKGALRPCLRVIASMSLRS